MKTRNFLVSSNRHCESKVSLPITQRNIFLPQNICDLSVTNKHEHVVNHRHYISQQHSLTCFCTTRLHLVATLLPYNAVPCTVGQFHPHTSDVSKSVFSINSTLEDSAASTLRKKQQCRKRKINCCIRILVFLMSATCLNGTLSPFSKIV